MTTSRRPASPLSPDSPPLAQRALRRRSLGQRISIGVISTLSVASLPSVAVAQDSTTTTSTTIPAAVPATTPTTTTPTTTSTTSTTTPTIPTTTVPATTAPATTTPATTTPAADPTTTIAPTTTTILELPPRDEVPATTTTTTVPAPATTATPAPPARNITVLPEQIQHILATIRYLESRGIYTLPPNKGNASGAYQFIGSTWGNYRGYAHAYLAPPAIQDERAAADVNKFLEQWNNDVSMIPVMWYYPVASRNPALMDIVPVPSAGNVLTIREYQTRWLGVFASISGKPIEPGTIGNTGTGASAVSSAPVDLSAFAGFAPEIPLSLISAPAMSFPVLGPSRVAVPECDGAVEIEIADNADGTAVTEGPTLADNEAAGLCTPQAPGIVFGVKLQPVLAVGDGMVTDVHNVDGETVTVTITNMAGISTTYSGFNDDNPGTDDGAAPDHLRLTALAEVGTGVRAGQVIGFMGNTSPLPIGIRADVPTDATVEIDPNAVAPHIRIMMVDIEGRPLDTFGPMIDALFRQTCRVMIGQWTVPENGSGFDPVTIETTDDDDDIDSEWNITSTGQVNASGWAALVNPTEGCGYAPSTAFGPGADGADGGLSHWENPIELSTDVWIALALQDEAAAPVFLRR